MNQDKSIRVAIADDKAINRNTISEKIKQWPELDLCIVAVNGSDLLEQLKGLPMQKQPEVIFMDIEMPLLDGIQAVQIGKSIYPDIHFIMLTIFDDEDKIFEAIRAGAEGYLLKDESASVLQEAVIMVMEESGAPISAGIARKALKLLGNASLQDKTKPAEASSIQTLLTDREQEILQLISKGFDAKRTAEIMSISTLTARKHIANIYKKLHISSKAEAMRIAYEHGFKS